MSLKDKLNVAWSCYFKVSGHMRINQTNVISSLHEVKPHVYLGSTVEKGCRTDQDIKITR